MVHYRHYLWFYSYVVISVLDVFFYNVSCYNFFFLLRVFSCRVFCVGYFFFKH